MSATATPGPRSALRGWIDARRESLQQRERFEQAGTRYYLLGETAMGWNEGTIADNRDRIAFCFDSA